MINNKKYLRTVSAISLGLFVSLACISSNTIAADTHQTKWTYQGESGPQNWSKLSKEYLACNNGKNQSPVNIEKTIDGKLPAIPYDYNILVAERIKNTGHSIQVDIRSGGTIKVDGKEFKLKQFHFHTPGENTIKDKSFPVEVHFVHASDDGKLAVIAMMYTMGAPDPLLDNLLRHIPFKKSQSNHLGTKDLSILETDKKLKQYIRFNGSLTTPPCTEGVIWLVKKPYLHIAPYQLDLLRRAIKRPNNRPVQATNARMIVD